jgi:phenylacetate-CoA ligase
VSTPSIAVPLDRALGASPADWGGRLRSLLVRVALAPVDPMLRFIGIRYRAFFWVICHLPPRFLALLGRLRAQRAVEHARRRVPGYARYWGTAVGERVQIGDLDVPTTDKRTYVLPFPIEQRCVGGSLEGPSVAVDESSGSTGTPFNWVRGAEERRATHVFISHFARYCFGDEPFVTVNAFSMGAWATGVNMGVALERNGMVKNTGPDADKVFSTLEFLGTGRRYLICGYPPFLKHLIDVAAERGFPLDRYRLMGLVGGEGMSEGLRDYLRPHFDPVYSGYGATDIEIGMAGETPLTVAIRRLAREDPSLAADLFGDDSRLPMLFQYNPLQHEVSVTPDGELVFTISRLEVLAPRIAYNIHDEGGAAPCADVLEVVRRHGHDLSGIGVVPLPMLWVFGRKDSTISVMGANLYPEDVEAALYDCAGLAVLTQSFCLGSHEQSGGTIRPLLCFEIRQEPDEALQLRFATEIEARLVAINADYRQASREHPAAMKPVVRLYRRGEGPFAADARKIKQTRMVHA